MKKNLFAKYYSRVIFYSLIPKIGWASDSKCMHNCFQMTTKELPLFWGGASSIHF